MPGQSDCFSFLLIFWPFKYEKLGFGEESKFGNCLLQIRWLSLRSWVTDPGKLYLWGWDFTATERAWRLGCFLSCVKYWEYDLICVSYLVIVYYICVFYVAKYLHAELFCTRLYSCLPFAKLKGILKKVSPVCLVWLTKWMCCEQILFSELSLHCSGAKCFPVSFSLFPTSHKSYRFPSSVALFAAHGNCCSVLH